MIDDDTNHDSESRDRGPPPKYVMPLASVLTSASVGLLTFLSLKAGSPALVFSWISSAAAVASLQAWAAMLFTYLRWYRGTVYYEDKISTWEDTPERAKAYKQLEILKEARAWGQPYVSRCSSQILTRLAC